MCDSDRILNEIFSFCEECPSHECCPEDECVLFRIEQIVLETDVSITNNTDVERGEQDDDK